MATVSAFNPCYCSEVSFGNVKAVSACLRMKGAEPTCLGKVVYISVTDVVGYIGNNVMTGCQLVRVEKLSD